MRSAEKPVLIFSSACVDATGRLTNVGDEAVTVSLQRFVQNRYPAAQVLSTNNPSGRDAVQFVAPDRFPLRPVRPLLRRVARARAIVFGGGTLLQVEPFADPSRPGPMLRWIMLVAASARLAGVPVAFCGVGADRLDGWGVERFAGLLLRLADSISCRDDTSVALLNGITQRLNVKRSADTTFLDPTGDVDFEFGTRREYHRVMLSLSAELSPNAIHETLQWLDSEILKHPRTTLTLCPTARADDSRSDEVTLRAAQERWPARCSWLSDKAGPEELRTLAKESRFAVGSRLHFLLLAAQTGCPILPIQVNAKVTAFASEIGRPPDRDRDFALGPKPVPQSWLRNQHELATGVIGEQIDALMNDNRHPNDVHGGAPAIESSSP